MCLLDALQDWSPQAITCTVVGHTAADHPLRTPHGLLAPAAIEIAAQAMALHGALIAEAAALGAPADTRVAPTPGMLASVRSVQLHMARLDTLPSPLHVRAERLAGDTGNLLYAFSVRAGEQPVANGRAAVILQPPKP